MVEFSDMSTESSSPQAISEKRKGRLKPIIVPAEHGGWGFLSEAILLGLLVAPTAAGALLAIATIAVFMARQPTKVLLAERQRRHITTRSRIARNAALIELAIAVIAFIGALLIAGPIMLPPLLLAAPLAGIFVYFDMSKTMRTLPAELAAPLALGAVTASMALIGGWAPPFAAAFWAVITARAIPSILLVRTRIRMTHKRTASPTIPLVAQGLAMLLIGGLIWVDLLPPLTMVGIVVLLVRALYYLFPKSRMIPARTVGFTEIGMGLQVVFFTALGVWLQ